MPPKYRPYDRHQIQFMTLSLDDLIASDHEVRNLWDYVLQMDLSLVTNAIKSQQGKSGAPTYDPRILLALWLYATARGVASSRQLQRRCQEDAPFRWLCADDAPNYHTLADFRSGNEALLDDLLAQNLAALVSENLLDLEDLEVAHDGMRVRAAAGSGSFRRRQSLDKALLEAQERVAHLKDAAQEQGPEQESKRRQAAQQRAAREREERVRKAHERLRSLEQKRRKKDRQEPRASTTDPEASRMKMPNGGVDAAHNLQLSSEVKSTVVLALDVADSGSDYGELKPAMDQVAERLGRGPKRALADPGFAKTDDVIALEQNGCEVFMPDKYGETQRGKKHPCLSAWRERMAKQENKEYYARVRPACAEWIHAQMRNRGFTRLVLRGKAKARVEGLWQVLVHNFYQTLRLRAEKTA